MGTESYPAFAGQPVMPHLHFLSAEGPWPCKAISTHSRFCFLLPEVYDESKVYGIACTGQEPRRDEDHPVLRFQRIAQELLTSPGSCDHVTDAREFPGGTALARRICKQLHFRKAQSEPCIFI